MTQEVQTEFTHTTSNRVYLARTLLTAEQIQELQTKTVDELNQMFIYIKTNS
jgi:hypothetical protein